MTDAARLGQRLDELYAIGGGPGANRIGGSAEEQRAHDLAAGWMEEAGLAVQVDSAGNLLARAEERSDIWTGSHLDSVPRGGKFDGALGVVAGIEAVERVGRGAVVAFRDEERGCAGSRALVGGGGLPACYLELHIEQGPVLEQAGAPLGIVTEIVGLVRAEKVFRGEPGHAGTVPLDLRRDALVAAAQYILEVRAAAASIDGAVATVGAVAVAPGAVNVVPDLVRLTVDARAPDLERLDRLMKALELEPSYRVEPASMAEAPKAVLRDELEERGLPLVELRSGAGHDAGVLARAGVPTGMLFVRSLNGGASHSTNELSSDEDVELAVDVLAGALARLTAP